MERKLIIPYNFIHLNAVRRCAVIIFTFLLQHSYAQHSSAVKQGMDYDSLIKAREEKAVGKKFSAFSALYKNNIFSNKDLNGKIVFANFWFAACPPCMEEMAALNELYDSLKSKPNFEFISFTYEKQGIIDSVAKAYNIKYKILSVTQQDCYRLNQNNGFPTSIIINARGNIKLLKTAGFSEKELNRNTMFRLFYPKLLHALKAKLYY